MYKNAIEKINKFYDLNLNSSRKEAIFDVLEEIIPFWSGAIFYLTPDNLSLEFSKNFDNISTIQINKKLSEKLYDTADENFKPDVAQFFNIQEEKILCEKLVIKGAVFGIIILEKENEDFSFDEKLIFKTCASIISNLIKDLELSKVLKMQVEALQSGIITSNKAYADVKRQNKKIKESEKQQNEFIANISHDLRTPLNSIIGFSELLSNKIVGDLNEKQNGYVEDIKIAGIKLLEMINEVLDIAKIESHTVKLNISNIYADVLIDEVCNIIKPISDKKHITITKNIIGEILFKGDFIKLQQVLFNILGNAVKFSPENSEIKISAKNQGDKVVIKIKDEGIGIAKKYHKKIFDKFFQVENSMSKTEASTGLGLAISKEFVKMHGGEISVDSSKGNGTEFTITLKSDYQG